MVAYVITSITVIFRVALKKKKQLMSELSVTTFLLSSSIGSILAFFLIVLKICFMYVLAHVRGCTLLVSWL